MKTLFKNFFFENWQRKLFSILIAVIIWFTVNHSLIVTKTISNIPVRIINIPTGKTIVDLQSNGVLGKRLNLTFSGNKTLLDDLTSNDLEVVIDAQNMQGEWIASISRRNLNSLNPEIDLNKGITRVAPTNVIIRLTKLTTEKIPIYITQPIGEAPGDYQFLDIWPHELTLSVSGPEEVMKRLKSKGVRLTLDLSDISKSELDSLRTHPGSSQKDEIAFFVPDQWKKVSIPILSDTPIEIDDPRAKDLRIDFVRVSLLPLNAEIPVNLYFPTENLREFNPNTVQLQSSPLIDNVNGVKVFSQPLFTKGVSQLFVRIVEQMMQINITVNPTSESDTLDWSIEFINPRLLEDQYVAKMMSDISNEEVRDLQPLLRESYLRNRFRSYINRFQLYQSDEKKLELKARLENNRVILEEGSQSLPNSKHLFGKGDEPRP